jgi:diguanylate cyclase (GGDEF)-like protein
VLREVALRLKGALRPGDSLGRYGGEEFLVVMPGSGSSGIASLADRLRRALFDAPVSFNNVRLKITASLGGTFVEFGQLVTPNALIRAADEASYHAKGTGRNRLHVPPPSARHEND